MDRRLVPRGCLLALVLLCGPAVSADTSHLLEGVWQYEKRIDTRPDGTSVDFPEPELEGMLIYRADGFMSLNLMPKGRTWTTEKATTDELRGTVADGTGYAGRYEIDAKRHTVTHIVSVSLDPMAQEQRLVWQYAVEGPTLILSGEWSYNGEPMLFHVVWKRMRPPKTPTDSSEPKDASAGEPSPGNPRSASPPAVAAPIAHLPALLAPGLARRTPDGGMVITALMTTRAFGFPYVGVALSIYGRVRYFRTTTTAPLAHRPPLHESPDVRLPASMFGEEVVLYGGDMPTRIVRENGEVYDLEPSESSTTFNFFSPKLVHTAYENPAHEPSNPHPEAILDECRRLIDPFEHDACLIHQAGAQNDARICEEFVLAERADGCRMWLANIRAGRINQ